MISGFETLHKFNAFDYGNIFWLSSSKVSNVIQSGFFFYIEHNSDQTFNGQTLNNIIFNIPVIDSRKFNVPFWAFNSSNKIQNGIERNWL